ncbi:MAG: enoyl-CoA hydratase/isomerase family protein [Eudoraea sp.]|nr:enoyl-CoA hydratase/isomerase family protein [Eudoraea sp.]
MSTDRQNGSLYTKIEQRVAIVEFGHPASNSFVTELLVRLTKEISALSENDEVNIIVLKSEGDRAFCAGASFDELVAIASPEDGKLFFSGFANLINAMRKCAKPIIGRVQGKAVGGGVGLISACDFVFATEAAAIRLSELSVGIAPLVIAPALERKMGKAAVAEMAFSPTEWKNAYWAKEKGLYSKVYDTSKIMDKELFFFTEKLASYNPEALKAMRKVSWEGTDHWDNLLAERAQMSGELALSPNTKQALEKFKNK